MIHIPIFFYSKYCKECPKILSVIDPNRFLFICIDNPNIRKKIVEDDRFQIKTVPCILYFENDTSFEKYEGENIVKWLVANNMFCIEEIQKEQTPIPEETNIQIPINDETETEIENEKEKDIENENENEISPTKNNILTLAQQMQRERESQPVV